MLLLSTTYRTAPNIPQRLTLYTDKIIWDHQHEFKHNQSATDQIFCMSDTTMEEYISYYRLQKSYNSVKRDISYNIFCELNITMELVGLFKMY
jgi:hypothetical protein